MCAAFLAMVQVCNADTSLCLADTITGDLLSNQYAICMKVLMLSMCVCSPYGGNVCLCHSSNPR
jgi:hypothetical protein